MYKARLYTLIVATALTYALLLGFQGANSSFKGTVALPEILSAPEHDRKLVTQPGRSIGVQKGIVDLDERLDRAFNAATGTVISARERISLVKRQREIAKQEIGSARDATEFVINKAGKWTEDSRKRIREIREAEDAAIEAGQDARAAQLGKARREELSFLSQLDDYVAAEKSRLKTVTDAETKEIEAAKKFIERRDAKAKSPTAFTVL